MDKLRGREQVQMNCRTFRDLYCVSVVLLLFALGTPPANAANVPISGSYEVIQQSNVGSQTKILVRLHLTNRGQSPLSVQGILLSDFGYPPSGGPLASPVTLAPGTSQEISQELMIPRLQFDQWQKGLSPRAILQMQSKTGASITQAIRMERVPAGKGQ